MIALALTTLEYALLGLLNQSPLSGYDISQIFGGTPLAHFSSSPGAIYPALKRLELRGLLTGTLDTTTETRPRRVYSLTEAGRSSLNAWLHQPVTRDEIVRDGKASVLRFSLSEGLSIDEMVAYLEGFRHEVSAYLGELRDFVSRKTANYSLPQRLALEHGIRSYECQAAWIEDAIAALKQGKRR